MSYAVFRENVRISEPFATKADAWAYAEAAGLVTVIPAHDEDPPRRVLSLSHSIRKTIDAVDNDRAAYDTSEAA